MVNGHLGREKYQSDSDEPISTIRGRPLSGRVLRAWSAENTNRFYLPTPLGRPIDGPTSACFNVAELGKTGFWVIFPKERDLGCRAETPVSIKPLAHPEMFIGPPLNGYSRLVVGRIPPVVILRPGEGSEPG